MFGIERKNAVTRFYPGQSTGKLCAFFPVACKAKTSYQLVQVPIATASGKASDARLNFMVSKSRGTIVEVSFNSY